MGVEAAAIITHMNSPSHQGSKDEHLEFSDFNRKHSLCFAILFRSTRDMSQFDPYFGLYEGKRCHDDRNMAPQMLCVALRTLSR